MQPLAAFLALVAVQASLSGCTGLVAGSEVKATTPVPASRDSAYVRTRRALQAESFTMNVVDSSGGILTGTRYPSADANWARQPSAGWRSPSRWAASGSRPRSPRRAGGSRPTPC